LFGFDHQFALERVGKAGFADVLVRIEHVLLVKAGLLPSGSIIPLN
jgi:hypothetical protein